MRSLQDWFLKFELQALDGVAEVATIGGMVKQYQVVVDPLRLRGYGIPLMMVEQAIRGGNQEVGGSVIEMAEAEYMVRATGYVKSIEDLERIPVKATQGGTAVLLRDVAEVRLGPEMRRGIGELDGEGEAVGGVIVMRNGGNARDTIVLVKAKLDELRTGLPAGVEIVETYDRASLIQRAVDHLKGKLLDEFIVVTLVCLVFLLHVRSGLIVVIVTPIAVLSAFAVMRAQGINANIMSLGGIAIAIGTLVDAAIVMIENVHKKLEREPDESQRLDAIYAGCREVGPSLFFSLMIVALSFLPVFTLEAQEGRLFAPLAYTKTYAMVWASLLSITLVPVLIYLLVRGKVRPESANPVNRATMAVYRPFLEFALRFPRGVAVATALLIIVTVWPASRLGTEFMPELDEGDFLYMPTTLPGLSTDAARALLQQTDKLITHGAGGRARIRQSRAHRQRHGSRADRDVRNDGEAQAPRGMAAGHDARQAEGRTRRAREAARRVERVGLSRSRRASTCWRPESARRSASRSWVRTSRRSSTSASRSRTSCRQVPGTTSVYAERTATGRYVVIDIDRVAAGRYGLNIDDVQAIVGSAVGGMTVSYTVEGLERYPINLRYPQGFRDSLEKLRQLPIVAPTGANITLQDVARVDVADGPSMIRSENARPSGWVFVDLQGRDLGGFVREAKAGIARAARPARRLQPQLVRAVRIPRARRRAPQGRRAADALDHRAVALPQFPQRPRRDDDPVHVAVCPGRRHLVHVAAGLRAFDRGRGGFHRAGRRGGGDGRRHAHVPRTRLGGPSRAGGERRAPARHARNCASQSWRARCCACGQSS